MLCSSYTVVPEITQVTLVVLCTPDPYIGCSRPLMLVTSDNNTWIKLAHNVSTVLSPDPNSEIFKIVIVKWWSKDSRLIPMSRKPLKATDETYLKK